MNNLVTVGELVAKLLTLPQDLPVTCFWPDASDYPADVELDQIEMGYYDPIDGFCMTKETWDRYGSEEDLPPPEAVVIFLGS